MIFFFGWFFWGKISASNIKIECFVTKFRNIVKDLPKKKIESFFPQRKFHYIWTQFF